MELDVWLLHTKSVPTGDGKVVVVWAEQQHYSRNNHGVHCNKLLLFLLRQQVRSSP